MRYKLEECLPPVLLALLAGAAFGLCAASWVPVYMAFGFSVGCFFAIFNHEEY